MIRTKKQLKRISNRTYPPKLCKKKDCNIEFIPTDGRQVYCNAQHRIDSNNDKRKAIDIIESVGITKFVSIPEIVRQWDSTWDCLVNENFISKPIGYQATNNPYIDTIIGDGVDPKLEEVRNNVHHQPYMKFGGGWFALISKELMKAIPFPENYGHYGLDDTYLMWGANILQDPTIKQFKLKNIVVCENYFDRITTYKGQIQFIDKREEYKKYNEELFYIGLQNILNNK